MKKIYTFFMVFVIALTTNAQMVFNENFTGLSNGSLGTRSNWVQTGTGNDVQVDNTMPLTYGGYPSGTQYVTVSTVSGISPHKLFTVGGANGGTLTTIPTNANRFIYMSFVVRVLSTTPSGNTSNYSIALLNTGSSNFPAGRFYINKNAAGTAVQFGVALGSEPPVFTGFNYSFNTTYLILMRYDVVSGNNNDNVYLWVNPFSPSGTEPGTGSARAASLANTGEVNYGNSLNALKIFQTSASLSPVASFDAFMVAHGASSAEAWTNLNLGAGALPVTLTSFNASQDALNNTKLVWNVDEETDVASYVIEKSTDGRTFTAVGSVPATHQKSYSFTDAQTASDYTYYRLKMVDIDGSYKLSFIISLKSKLSLSISLSPNPVKNALLIQHPKSGTEGRIQIVNANGQLIKDLRLPASAVLTTVDMTGLATGLYHVVFKNGTDVFSKMVLKQ